MPAPVPGSEYPHIELTKQGIPILAGTTLKVVELVMAQRAHGWSPEEIHLQYPHLTMSQVHAALAYYWDHQTELDADIERRSQRVDDAEGDSETPPVVERFRALKRKP